MYNSGIGTEHRSPIKNLIDQAVALWVSDSKDHPQYTGKSKRVGQDDEEKYLG